MILLSTQSSTSSPPVPLMSPASLPAPSPVSTEQRKCCWKCRQRRAEREEEKGDDGSSGVEETDSAGDDDAEWKEKAREERGGGAEAARERWMKTVEWRKMNVAWTGVDMKLSDQ